MAECAAGGGAVRVRFPAPRKAKKASQKDWLFCIKNDMIVTNYDSGCREMPNL